jgi:hypothetical protein
VIAKVKFDAFLPPLCDHLPVKAHGHVFLRLITAAYTSWVKTEGWRSQWLQRLTIMPRLGLVA